MSKTHDQISPVLCPPGQGVHTVHTAKENKDALNQLLYQTSDLDQVQKKWNSLLKKAFSEEGPQTFLFGICSDTGGGIQRGANWGPLFLRKEVYQDKWIHKEKNFYDLGDVRVIPHLLHDKYLNEETLKSCRKALYDNEKSQLPVSPLSQAEYVLNEIYQENESHKVLTLGGDHSCSYPAVKSFLQAKKKAGKKVALLHFDAHTDLLTSRLGIDLCFGSWVPHILDDLPAPDYLIQIGIRSSGQNKDHWEKTFGLKQFWAPEIKKQGAPTMAKKMAEHLEQKDIDEIYVSFDIDCLDGLEAGATGTPELGGLTTDECLRFLMEACKRAPLTGADIMEVAPFVKIPLGGAKVNPEPESTLLHAHSLMTFFLEKLLENNLTKNDSEDELK